MNSLIEDSKEAIFAREMEQYLVENDSIKAIYVRAVEQYFAENSCQPLESETRQGAILKIGTLAIDMMMDDSDEYSNYLLRKDRFNVDAYIIEKEIDKFQDDLASIVKNCASAIVRSYFGLDLFEQDKFDNLVSQTCILIDEQVSQQERFCTFVAQDHKPLVVDACMELLWQSDNFKTCAEMHVCRQICSLLENEPNTIVFGNDFWFRIYQSSHHVLAFDFVVLVCRRFFVEHVDEQITRICCDVLANHESGIIDHFDVIFTIAIKLYKTFGYLSGASGELAEMRQVVRQVFGVWMQDLDKVERGKEIVEAAQLVIFMEKLELDQVEQIYNILSKYWRTNLVALGVRLENFYSIFGANGDLSNVLDEKSMHEIAHVLSKKPCLRSCGIKL